MKKYRIKEEVKKYFPQHLHNKELGYEFNNKEKECWHYLNVTIEALEEVEEKIEIEFYQTSKTFIVKKRFRDFTEQEREDIEKFLNVFGSWENLKRWGEIEVKEKGYEK